MSCTQAQNTRLDDFQWENRLLIIYTREVKSSQLDNQLAEIIRNNEGYNVRDLKVILLRDRQVKVWNSEKDNALNFDQTMKELNIDQSILYYNLLIGKDGGVKSRRISPITNKKLFETIDAMPMRQREMRIGN
ncbi:DUF4174 domain-containing protein [Marivirga harenae]|uniref:DUF4174 domain-containing protein n=1 Tax=Marivirga harenae TaxID=2010992 RepID=UPI0026DEA1A6|nr:DUF4174 domain-containing protein [Marivirga harenae]WKV11938.1 DUF4174 domain-containing protein [Marivirga harenae]